jgi:hypothetical protein
MQPMQKAARLISTVTDNSNIPTMKTNFDRMRSWQDINGKEAFDVIPRRFSLLNVAI